MGKGSKILDGLRDAVAGNFAAVTIEGETWVKKGHETPEHLLMETRKTVTDLQLESDILRDALRVAREEILWWADEHKCCHGHEAEAIAKIQTALGEEA